MSNVRLVGFSCLCFLLHIAPLCCFSHETVMIDGVVWNYEKTGGGVYLGAWMGATNAVDRSFVGDLVLPNEINGDKVIGICESAFRDCIGIRSITFTTNIVSIGNAAFNGCARLGSISVPNSVTTIGYAIFGGCTRLSDISIPFVGIRRGNDESEAALFGYMFGGTKHEGDVEIFQKFWTHSGRFCEERTYYLPKSLKNVRITDEEVIAAGAFYGCAALTSVDISGSVARIGLYAFGKCEALTSITIRDGVNQLGNRVFDGCISLTSVTIPNSVISMGEGIFNECRSLSNVNLPFVGCARNSSGKEALFGYLFGAYTIPPWEGSKQINQGYSTGPNDYLTCYFPTSLVSVIITDAVKIGNYAFSGFDHIQSVIIYPQYPLPTSIGTYAFSQCSALSEIIVPLRLAIGNYAFPDTCEVIYQDWVTIDVIGRTGCEIYNGVGYSPFTLSCVNPDALRDVVYDAELSEAKDVGEYRFDFEQRLFANTNSHYHAEFKVRNDACFSVVPRSVKVYAEDRTKIYDGQPLTPSVCVVGDGFVAGECTVSSLGSQIQVGTSNSAISLIWQSEANPSNYDVLVEDGLLTVLPAKIPTNDGEPGIGTLTADGISKFDSVVYYDGDGHSINTNSLNAIKLLADTPSISYSLCGTVGYQNEPILFTNVCSTSIWYKISAKNYEDYFHEARITVLPRNVILTSGSATKKYDGAELVNDELTISGDGFVGNDGVTWTCTGSQTEIGSSQNTFVYEVTHGTLPCNYAITEERGVLTVDYVGETCCPHITVVSSACEEYEITISCDSDDAVIYYTIDGTVPNENSTIYKGPFIVVASDLGTQIKSVAIRPYWAMSHEVKKTLLSVSQLMKGGLDDIPEAQRESLGLHYDEDGFMIWNGWLLDFENREASELVLPEGVIGIGHCALADMYDLETVRLPSSLKYIGVGAFARDTYLDNMEIPDSVLRIGDGGFEDCSWMQTISVGRGVECVGSRAFAGCTKLARIRFEDGLSEIGDCAFSNCWRMLSVSLPLSVTNVATTAFQDCSSLTGANVPTCIEPLSTWFAPVYRQIKDVTIPSGETLVCDNMFKGCSSLVSASIPEGITNIGDRAFEDCVCLPSVLLPYSLQSVGESAFHNCDALTAIGLPDAVRSVGAYAFYDCHHLKDVSLSKNLESLPDHAFCDCPQLDSIYVPASVTQLGNRVFGGAMRAVYFIGNAPTYDADVYASTDCGLVTYVKYGTKGWDGRPNSRDLPQKWPTDNSYGRNIMTWDPVQFDVTFDAVDGVFYPVEANTYDCEQIMYTAYSLPPFNPVRKGYKFAGWWTETVGGTEVTPSTGVKLDRSHKLYAHWDESYVVTVRFNACEGTVLPSEIECTAEEPFGALPVPTREHYVFTGWYTAASGGSIVRASTEVPKADCELFAHWLPAHYEIRFNANNGTDAKVTQDFIYGDDVTLRTNEFACLDCEFAGWSLTPGGEAVYADGKTISGLAAIEDGRIDLYAVWAGNVYAVRFDSHGGLGIMPNQTFVLGVPQILSHCTFMRRGYVFKGWALTTTGEVSYGDGEVVCDLTSNKDATVALFAVWERDPQGEWTVEEYLNCTNLTFTLGGDEPLWYGEKVARADKVGMMRSGAIADSQTNWIETVVSGEGQVSFWWKANGEYEVSKKGVITRYDYAEFTIDGFPVAEIGDESGWTSVTISVEGAGTHTLRWMYHKDETGFDGDDCAWLSEITWEPVKTLEPIPELPENPTVHDLQSALAGSADGKLLTNITDVVTYNKYREWAMGIGSAEVKSSTNAWASFAVDSAALLEKMLTDEDLKVEEFKASSTVGTFEFTVGVEGVTIGDKASEDNLKKLFGLEGAESLDSSKFSSENVDLDFKTPQNGKLKFTATPVVEDAKCYFMKVKVK